MAHEVENMMYVGKTPWHGLGKRFVEAPPLDEAIIAAGLDWEVVLNPIFDHKGNEIANKKALTRVTDDKVFNVVGKRYQPLQNSAAFNWFQPFLDANECSIETAGSLRGGKRAFILAKINRDPSVIVKGDEVEKYILLSNTHDGITAVRAGFTPIRVVCSNTLGWAISNKESQLIRVRHSKNIEDNLAALRESMNVANSQFEANAEQFRWLASREINAKDLEKYIRITFNIPDAKIGKRQNSENKTVSNVVSLFESGLGTDIKGVRGTYWGAYNAVTEYLGHHKGKDQDRRVDSNWFGPNNLIAKKALILAMNQAA